MPDLDELKAWIVPFFQDWTIAGGALDYEPHASNATNFVGDVTEPSEWVMFEPSTTDAARVTFLGVLIERLTNG